MNSKDRTLLAELKNDIKWIKSTCRDLRTEVKEHNDKLDENAKTLATINTGFKNHLKHHEIDLKKTIAYATVAASIIGTVVTLILHFAGG